MAYKNNFMGNKLVQFEDFSNFISVQEFREMNKNDKRYILSSFVLGLTINKIRHSLDTNLIQTLNKSIRNNLIWSFKNVR